MVLTRSYCGIITAGIAVVMTIVSVAGQLYWSDCSRGGCRPPNNLPSSVGFVLTRNFAEVYDISSSCFPLYTTLLYVCKDHNTHQFTPTLFGSHLLNRKCAGNGWLDDSGVTRQPPKCEQRKRHCLWPPVPIGPNIFVQIDSQNVSIADSNAHTVRYYSEGTIATYKCMYPKSVGIDKVQQTWRCTAIEERNNQWTWWNPSSRRITYWKWISWNAQELFCGSPDQPLDITPTSTEEHATAKTTSIFTTETSFTFGHNEFDFIDFTDPQQTTQPYIITGICGAVAFVLIALLLGVCYQNRVIFGKRYRDNADCVSQRSLAPIMEAQTNCYQSNEENSNYVNIIPIKVNSEAIYTEVETGKVGHDKKIDTKVKYTVHEDQLQTVYAEIHHPK